MGVVNGLSADGMGVLMNKIIIFNLGLGWVGRDLEQGRRVRSKKDVVEHLCNIFEVSEQRFSVNIFPATLGIFLVSLFSVV